jgi:cytochrome c
MQQNPGLNKIHAMHAPLKKVLPVFLLFHWLAACRQPEKAKQSLPEENRFHRVILKDNLFMPMMVDIGADGQVYLIEANGKLSRIDPVTKTSLLLGTVENADQGEHGLIGMALDPQVGRNHWIYLQYFLPHRKDLVAQISRFTLVNDSLDLASEKKYIQIPYDNTCCHTAGCLSFDAQGNLYFSSGDNTDAFQNIYSPQDERAGHEFANGFRSAANSMDLRGKICRIHPEDDGHYSIPEGNLFPGGKGGRPEIYIMGCRNPYRLFADKPTNRLLWGEVGPDAGVDSSKGPRGYDEFNIALKAGNYGWPLFIANNIPYAQVDSTGRIEARFDPAKPLNASRLNTGVAVLPPAQPATIFYPYARSTDFPQLGEGGRCAVGGPVYHYDPALSSGLAFPEYFDGAWFIGDWMRNWLKAVRLNGENRVTGIDDIMPSEQFKKPIDMVFSPKDGALYLLEFGETWGPGAGARLERIEYHAGNRAPVARLTADAVTGKNPLTLHFSGRNSMDYDHDSLRYDWLLDGQKMDSHANQLAYTFRTAGIHRISLTVTDPSGASDTRNTEIIAGNTAPEIAIHLVNHSFYWDSLRYDITVTDNEDGSIGRGIDPDAVQARLSYRPGQGNMEVDQGRLVSRGEVLLNESDCKSCHGMNELSVGPAFFSIARKYYRADKDPNPMLDSLARKVITGGSGVWGTKQMSAHPQLSKDQTTQMVDYIFSLAAANPAPKRIPLSGNLMTKNNSKPGKEGYYTLEASYTDRGGAVRPLSDSAREILRYHKLYPGDFEKRSDMVISNHQLSGLHSSFAELKNIDLSGIRQAVIRAAGSGGVFELHIDSIQGRRIAVFPLDTGTKGAREQPSPLEPVQGRHDLYLVYLNREFRFNWMAMDWISFE